MKTSAGILLYRNPFSELQVFLVHPGGPFWKNKDDGAWSIPKGEIAEDEAPLAAALREFREETGFDITGHFIELAPVKQKGGKTVSAWAVEGTVDESALVSNTFSMEWPPRSGKQSLFPEVDKGQWFSVEQALKKINASQASFVTSLLQSL